MGQHKYNPTAIAAKNGELPPKKPNFTKREREAELHRLMLEAAKDAGILPTVMLAEMIASKPYEP